ncbi:MAG: sigma-70 family RNA polymerase sigma factor [Xanthomonadales bacterium]|nr:sigma-70 family RNA polymerase sigma factor [Xanthomonadales bacterium]
MIDQAELERLFVSLERSLFNIAARWTWNEAEAQELVQEAFMRVWARRRRLRTDTAKSYVYRTLINLAQKFARRRDTWHRVRSLLPGAAEGPATPDQHFDGEQVRDAIRDLPEAQRTVLLMCEYTDLKQREIAEILKLPPGTVASRRNAALARLRVELRENVGEADRIEERVT